jgi:hypothetical protein
MHHPMEDIREHFIQMLRFGKVDSSGQQCIKIQRNLSEGAPDARNKEISKLEM